MSGISNFDYEGQSISFEFSDGNKMVNATQMAKPFKKRVSNFLRLNETKRFVELLETRYSDVSIGKDDAPKEVLRVVKGGEPHLQGTWMDEKLALKFAAWLSPAFELWVYDRIQELLLTGKTAIKAYNPSGVIKALRMVIDEMEQQNQFNVEIRSDVNEIAERMDELEAKITSIDEHYYSVSGYCALNSILAPQSKAQKWGFAATKLSHQKGYDIGKAYDAKFGQVNTYHKDVLKEVIKNG